MHKYLKRSRIKVFCGKAGNFYWFRLKDNSIGHFRLGNDNSFYFRHEKIMWLEAMKFIEMIGNDWNG